MKRKNFIHFPRSPNCWDHKASIAIKTLKVLEGELPPGQLSKVKKWAETHKSDLLDRWKLAMDNKPIPKIE